MRLRKNQSSIFGSCLIVAAIAVPGAVAGQEVKPAPDVPAVQEKAADPGAQKSPSSASTGAVRPGAPVTNADLSGTRGDVVVDSNGGYSTVEGGVVFKPKTNYPWTVDLIGSSSGGFAIVNSNKDKQLFKVQDNGATEVLGPSSTSGLLIRDSNAVGMGQGGVEVKVSGNSAFISGVVQIGAYGSGMINTLNNSQPIALNAWSPADATFLQRSPRHAAVDHVKRGNQSAGDFWRT